MAGATKLRYLEFENFFPCIYYRFEKDVNLSFFLNIFGKNRDILMKQNFFGKFDYIFKILPKELGPTLLVSVFFCKYK